MSLSAFLQEVTAGVAMSPQRSDRPDCSQEVMLNRPRVDVLASALVVLWVSTWAQTIVQDFTVTDYWNIFTQTVPSTSYATLN